MQVSHYGVHADCCKLSIRKPLGPLDRVPKDFKVSTQTQTAWCARAEDACQIEQADLLASGGKPEVWPHYDPTALAIRYFHAQRQRVNLLTLTDGHVDRRICRVQPAFGNQPQRATLRRVIAEIDFDVMIARHALITTAAKIIQIVRIKGADDVRHVVAIVVHRVRDLVWLLDSRYFLLGRPKNTTLIPYTARFRRPIHGPPARPALS